MKIFFPSYLSCLAHTSGQGEEERDHLAISLLVTQTCGNGVWAAGAEAEGCPSCVVHCCSQEPPLAIEHLKGPN